MRGVLYRTDDQGNLLAQPELKVSALKNGNFKVYANQAAKEAALAAGDIKPGDVVLSGEDANLLPITMQQLRDSMTLDFENMIDIGSTLGLNSEPAVSTIYTADAYGFLFIYANLFAASGSTSPSFSVRYNASSGQDIIFINASQSTNEPLPTAQIPIAPGQKIQFNKSVGRPNTIKVTKVLYKFQPIGDNQ